MTEREGRYLGGRPPYGYRLADRGLHPNPEKAAVGIQLHRLEPDPRSAPVVGRIFSLYLAGEGYRSIAQRLTDEGVLSLSAYDPKRNSHRSGRGWSMAAVRAILCNPRYTAYEVWGRQPRFESLLDPSAPPDAHVTSQREVERSEWRRSAQPVHDALVDG
jgi:hypothetical protein